jgi:type I restriction enzyme S subunit
MAGAAMPRITLEKLGNFLSLFPPFNEQQEIAAYLDEKTSKIDKLISELNTQLAELADYKQAVISEAVTGKVDVRNYRI